ncbi:unnamed protein product [Adineta ricciae]|uniref:EGF-like domain-containing protein n=1 Tax=Adineta ricciae TaxID=249248 RepID=A0A814D4F5_ADIRI|nr:unnamed protein product [Adineta ricciae]CAF1071506.1 unnamed protein product [Adineta ricciae]
MLLLFSSILILSISLTNAATLDESCSNDVRCEGASLICSEGKCQCRVPLYRPCNSSCVLNPRSAYEGETCEERSHCINNAECSENKRCQCLNGFSAKNGLCYKKLNESCASNTECRSRYCLNHQCACGHGYELNDDRTECRRKLVKIYSTWADANASNAFCSDDASCIDLIAKCFNDTQHPTAKFCKCPYGYEVKNNNEKCEPIQISALSPLNTVQSNYAECGVCEDKNAVCIRAATQTTCWCQAGYKKENNRCVPSNKPLLLFPNSYDLSQHDFTTNFTDDQYAVHSNLIGCAPKHRFNPDDRSCVKIEPKWESSVLEYGSCTRINSRYRANREDGLCPQPLTCQDREDKYVCSCGKDKFLDSSNSEQCVYLIGKKTNSVDDLCPQHASRNNSTGTCECHSGYAVVADNRGCELKLSSESFSTNPNRPYDEVCTQVFGRKVYLYTAGECRCSGDESFPNAARTNCYAPLNHRLTAPIENCPENAILDGDQCRCTDGYYPKDGVRCEKAKLLDYQGSASTSVNSLTETDCRTWFNGPVKPYDNEHCECRNGSSLNDHGTGCWFNLNITLTNPSDSQYCPPHSNTGAGQECLCDNGYKPEGNRCVQIATQVYSDDDSSAESTPGLNEAGCRHFFGSGATLSTKGQYCICKPEAYAVLSNTYCHFLIDEMTDDIKGDRTCPANAETSDSASSPWACICKPNYHKSSDNRTCIGIPLKGTSIPSASTSCQSYTNENCVEQYGEFAFCQNENCYCNRQFSFINSDNKCEPFSKNIFPGFHELGSYACNANADCSDKPNAICDYTNSSDEYKVCQCREGYILDIATQACVKHECVPQCSSILNFECRGYQCVCREGYHQRGSVCVENSHKLELHQFCNRTLLGMLSSSVSDNDSLQCDKACSRVRCKDGYRSEQNQCVRYELNNDRCVDRESICAGIDTNSICSSEENKCLCKPSFYDFENKCYQAVGSECTEDKQCGPTMICKGQRCACNDEQREEETTDIYGRPIRRCVNGIDRLRFSPLILLIVVFGLFFK